MKNAGDVTTLKETTYVKGMTEMTQRELFTAVAEAAIALQDAKDHITELRAEIVDLKAEIQRQQSCCNCN